MYEESVTVNDNPELDACHCGLPPILHTVKAPGSDSGRQFFGFIQKKE